MKVRLAVAAAFLSLPSLAFGGPPPAIDARAVFVQDVRTGDVLYASHARARVPIASITKLMTVLLTLDHARLRDVVTVPAGAAQVGESSVNLRPGERITVRDLLEAALVQSANDAAWTLAFHVGGGSVPRFVAMMNARARALGLRDTHFARPDGLDAPGHVSSARDLTRLARIAMRRPIVRAIVRQQTATIAGGRILHTWNDLLSRFPGLFGVKTGHTSLAGWSEVAAARRSGVTLYATILGSPARERRNADLQRLLDWALSRYRVTTLVRPGRAYATATAPYGRGRVALVPARRLRRVVRVDRPLVERTVAPATVQLPVRRGEAVGEVRVYQRGRLLGRRSLVASRSIASPTLASRLAWYTGKTFRHVWSWVT